MITLNMTHEEFEDAKNDLIEFLEVEKLLRRARKTLISESEHAPETKAEINEALDWVMISINRIITRLAESVCHPDFDKEVTNE